MRYFRSLYLVFLVLISFKTAAYANTQVCIDVYTAPVARPQPIERFESRIAFLENRIRGTRSFDAIVDRFNSSKVRRLLVQFQALFKIYEQIPASREDLAIIDQGRRDLKILEDVIGDLQRGDEIVKRARKAGVDPKILAMLEEEAGDTREAIVGRLKAGEWLPYPLQHLRQFRDRIQIYEFKRKKKDQRAQVEALIGLIKDYRRDLKRRGDYFVGRNFSEDELDGGIHEVRRALRWVLAIIQASDGLYKYRTDSLNSNAAAELEARYGDHEYLDLPHPMKGAIELNRRDLLLLSRYVMEFGVLKNFKEGQLDLRDYILKHKLETPEDAERISLAVMVEKYGPLNVEAASRKLYREYLARDPLQSLQNTLEDALAESERVGAY